ncbi:glycine betaine/L-proline ABC transporter ATP-binding protein [Solwaraspora sp. WMMD791]|nr:glycine betaine/L-proline ABC transporter ATP-binding protein [Solwaraspora sp. WMMD791]WFE24819.1 glycine betaine/L-proline ABC transporter ATP-binding protein [Solwaraspora sp. WMMD791]
MSAIVVKSLYKIFGKRADKALEQLRAGRDDTLPALGATGAVVDANFEVRRGEIFVVMGLSGSGKSTLIRMLNGLLPPTSGTVEIDGVDITRLKPAALRKVRREKISMVFQHFALLPHRSVLENAGYALEAAGLPRAQRREQAMEALRLVGLDQWADKLPQQLSGGMRQRVGLARALAAGTDIMLMDEAFSALDPLIRREVQDQLLDLQAQLGKTIVFITHDLNEAMRLGDRIAVMRAGRIVQIGTAEEILTDPSNDYVAQFVADVDRTRILTASSVMERPLGVVDENSGPRVAARVLRENQISAVYVTGRGQTVRRHRLRRRHRTGDPRRPADAARRRHDRPGPGGGRGDPGRGAVRAVRRESTPAGGDRRHRPPRRRDPPDHAAAGARRHRHGADRRRRCGRCRHRQRCDR